MRVITEARDLSALRGCVLVPTMGALHEGHAALIRRGAARAESTPGSPGCAVTIFVNPTQFNDPGDLAKYPRTLEADVGVCARAGASLVFAPAADLVYPAGQVIGVPALPGAATQAGLEDAHRPGHFAGVVQVVKRLFDLTQPSAAIFGEKDWQQWIVIRAVTEGLALPIALEACPTVREADGLAMSSRNRFLAAPDRVRALALSRALRAAGEAREPSYAEDALWRVLTETAGVEVEYAVVRDARTLLPLGDGWSPGAGRAARALIAARVGGVRLIDNAPWGAA